MMHTSSVVFHRNPNHCHHHRKFTFRLSPVASSFPFDQQTNPKHKIMHSVREGFCACVECHFIDTYSTQLRILIVIYKRPKATIKLAILYGFQLALFMVEIKKNRREKNVPKEWLVFEKDRTVNDANNIQTNQTTSCFPVWFPVCVFATIVFNSKQVFQPLNHQVAQYSISACQIHLIFISLSV